MQTIIAKLPADVQLLKLLGVQRELALHPLL
jgi:hypothetical protein